MSGDEIKITEAEAAQRLLSAFLVEFADRADDDPIPLRRFVADVADAMHLERNEDVLAKVDEWITVGELRARTRAAFTRLANGETP